VPGNCCQSLCLKCQRIVMMGRGISDWSCFYPPFTVLINLFFGYVLSVFVVYVQLFLNIKLI